MLNGCAIARVEGENSTLRRFSRQAGCALQRALDQGGRNDVPRQSELAGPDIPTSNMAILLLQTPLYDAQGCKCEEESTVLEAPCRCSNHPRSYICLHGWVFVLDGLAEAVMLRPHNIPRIEGESRSEVGFDFVAVCPLSIHMDKQNAWKQAPFAYGKVVMY